MPADSERTEEGLSRRQVLARGAVAAGVVWAAPVIRSATAYATSSAGTERPCINFYLVAVDALGIRPVRFKPDSPFGYDDIPDDVVAAMAAATTTTTSSTTTSSTSTTTTTTTTKPPANRAQSRRPATTTSTTTTTTTRPPLPDRGIDETASDFVPQPTTPTTAPRSTPKPATPTPRDPDPAGVVSGDPGAAGVEDFGLFTDPAAIAAAAPPPTNPADPHAVLFAAAAAAAQAGTPDSLPPGIKDWLTRNPDVPVRYPTTLPMLTQTGDEAWALLLAPVDGPDPLTHQCRGVNGWAQSKDRHAEFFVDPNPPSADEAGRRLIFPNPRVEDLAKDPSALIETVFFVFCCPQ